MKSFRVHIIALAVVFVILLLLQLTAPRDIDWTPSFTKSDKIPYGAYILYQLLPSLFPSRTISSSDQTVFKSMVEESSEEAEKRSYIIINKSFKPSELDTRRLLEFVSEGNSVFIAAETFSSDLTDTLGFETDATFSMEDTTVAGFTNPMLKPSKVYFFKKEYGSYAITGFDSSSSTILGEGEKRQPNFIRVEYGDGNFYINTMPYAFTNYNLMDRNNAEYAAKALSYLPDQDLLWDEYYKEGRAVVTSPLRFILGREPLKWAYLTLIAGVALFVIFMGRRRQRIIPIVKPLPNTTLEFAETVGRLYYQHRDNRNLAEKKILYFQEYIRSKFGIATGDRSPEFYRTLAGRSGVEQEAVEGVFRYIDRVLSKTQIGDDELGVLNRAIDNFYTKSRR